MAGIARETHCGTGLRKLFANRPHTLAGIAHETYCGVGLRKLFTRSPHTLRFAGAHGARHILRGRLAETFYVYTAHTALRGCAWRTAHTAGKACGNFLRIHRTHCASRVLNLIWQNLTCLECVRAGGKNFLHT